MKLLKATLKNFKGIKYFVLDTQGGNVSVFGDNATGKTSLFDAIMWLLFGKDSQNKTEFGIKTRDAAGNEIHNIENEVEATFEVKGRDVTLRKVYSEVWTKRTGRVSKEHTGHKTDYYIDGVPKLKKEYEAYILDIIDESIFKLITNPLYFNEQLHWKERRKTLLDICGDISDDDVIASDSSLSKLRAVLNGRSIDDHRKVIAARRTKINEELEKIPVRIDEATRGLPDISNIFHPEVIRNEIISLRNQQQAKQQELTRVETGGEVAEKKKQISQIDGRLIDIQNKHRSETSDKVYQAKSALQGLEYKITGIDSAISQKRRDLQANETTISSLNAQLERLREEWHYEDKRQFELVQSETCPACGQGLPSERLAETRQSALSQFNLGKAEALETISATGKRSASRIDEFKQTNSSIQADIEKLLTEKATIEAAIAPLKTEIESMSTLPDINSNQEYVKALQERSAIQAQIDAINGEKQSVISKLQSDINLIGQDIAGRERQIAAIEQHEQGQARIKELSAQEKDLTAEFEKLEGELFLTEQFIRAKVNMLEDRINSKFKYARFKLFSVQMNGGLEECCETTFNGVPFSAGLNNAARINVGIDIINTLSDYYHFSAPIFVDNAEAVTKLIETKSQVIALVVSEPDKALRVVNELDKSLKVA